MYDYKHLLFDYTDSICIFIMGSMYAYIFYPVFYTYFNKILHMHVAVSVSGFLNCYELNKTMSPDLSLIEHLWDVGEQRKSAGLSQCDHDQHG